MTKLLQDAQDANPLVRALVVRTMGCIRVHRIAEYLCDPLQLALTVTLTRNKVKNYLNLPLQDGDPYVRKTAVLCVAKLFEIDPELVESR